MTDFENTLNQLLSDPGQMEKLIGVAKAFMGSPDNEAPPANAAVGEEPPVISGLDPKIIGIIGKLMGEYNSGSDKETLMRAISPYLKAERRRQFERATEMAKLARMAKAAIGELGGL